MSAFVVNRKDFHYRYMETIAPAETVISPLDFPELVWSPTEEEYERARLNLRNAFDTRLYTSLPKVDPQLFTVAYLTHVEFSRELIEAEIGTRFFIPVFARGMNNDGALEPHVYWEYFATLASRGMTTLHMWAPEDEMMRGGVYDRIFTRGTMVSEFCESGFNHNEECLIVHMLLSKRRDGTVEDRRQQLGHVLAIAKGAYRRIIVCENRNAGEDAGEVATTILGDIYVRAPDLFSPGFQDVARNVFLIFNSAG
jgi:hypothetical protein